ncbi:GNAT family N-acetyltransferase [Arthrobacter sp. MYb227]|uniref:GNAT family N-acetyltransferase n=1 Tax=Arthrobacter sp. MYb227 TaxID=1848601 RepID=UPI0015E3CF44|nr:GNAT family N-acetyltransferase [Arthrobacter sp. MYb227]
MSLNTIAAVFGGEVARFSDVSEYGYIDMMFVAPRYGRQGVASALLSHLYERAVVEGVSELWTQASITARPFFERHGFIVAAEQYPITHGARMINYRMTRQLTP